MKQRVVDGLLLLVIVVGGVLAGRAAWERSRLGAEYRRLAKKTGELPILDASKLYIGALETGEPLHFAWRVYLPPHYRLELRYTGGSRSSSSHAAAVDSIARVRLREDEQGLWHVYTQFPGGGSRSQLDGPPLAALLRQHWKEIEVQQLGAGGPVALDANQSAQLLRLRLPPHVQETAQTALPEATRERLVPVLFELHVGPKPPGR